MAFRLASLREDGAPPRLGELLLFGLALASLGAGIIHCSAAPRHASLPLHAAFFVVSGLAQILWAALVLRRAGRSLLWLGAAGNLALVGVWLLSRTIGIGFVPGAEHVEPVGLKDSLAVFLELCLVAGIAMWAMLPRGRRELVIPRGRTAFVAMLAAGALVVAGGVVAPTHGAHEAGELASDHHAGDAEGAHSHSGGKAHSPTELGHHATKPGHAHGEAMGGAPAAHEHDAGHPDEHDHGIPLAAGPSRHVHPQDGAVDHGGASHAHQQASDEHRHGAGQASGGEPPHDYGQDHHEDHDDHDHHHGGGGPLDNLVTLIEETGKGLGLR